MKKALSLPGRVFLAPMAGITSLSFRMLNREFGCGCAFLEMVNAHSLTYLNKKTQTILQTLPEDRPLGVQLLGSVPDILLKGLFALGDYKVQYSYDKKLNKGILDSMIEKDKINWLKDLVKSLIEEKSSYSNLDNLSKIYELN